VTIPAEFPKYVPLPPGIVITANREVGPAIVLEGFVPMELPKAMRFFLQKLTAAGFGWVEARPSMAKLKTVSSVRGRHRFFQTAQHRTVPGCATVNNGPACSGHCISQCSTTFTKNSSRERSEGKVA